LIIDADNARPHSAKKFIDFVGNNGLRKASHTFDSPDLAPCDFFLFRYIKEQLEGASFDDGD
jgi:hypothetical protein